MKKVLISKKVIKVIDDYIENYLNYYENLYLDTGIFAIEEIKKFYIKDSIIRRKELISILVNKFSNDLISYPSKKVITKWRSKSLIVKFEDREEERIILDLEIR